MRLLIVHNPGKFAQKVIAILKEAHEVHLLPIERKESEWLSKVSEQWQAIEALELDAILYVSGETRDVHAMYALNFWLPAQLLDFSVRRRLKFVYLSSLAVWAGDVCSDCVSLHSQRQPIDTYGYTKCAFDRYVQTVREAHPEHIICGLYPASFYSGNGRSSIESYQKLLKKIFFLKYFRFAGCVSYASVEKIVDAIETALCALGSYDRIVADSMPIQNIKGVHQNIRWRIPVPRFPLWFFACTKWFLSRKFLLRIRMVLRGIDYV